MILLDFYDFFQELPRASENEEKFIVYCGKRELPVMATFNIEDGMFYSLSGKMLMNVTLWFKVPSAKTLWFNIGKEL